jgi:hypothetical protein
MSAKSSPLSSSPVRNKCTEKRKLYGQLVSDRLINNLIFAINCTPACAPSKSLETRHVLETFQQVNSVYKSQYSQ